MFQRDAFQAVAADVLVKDVCACAAEDPITANAAPTKNCKNDLRRTINRFDLDFRDLDAGRLWFAPLTFVLGKTKWVRPAKPLFHPRSKELSRLDLATFGSFSTFTVADFIGYSAN